MGLSASQARFLQLTARRGDIEYEAQRINFERLQLASNLSDASNKYEEATTNRQLTFSFNTGSGVQGNIPCHKVAIWIALTAVKVSALL